VTNGIVTLREGGATSRRSTTRSRLLAEDPCEDRERSIRDLRSRSGWRECPSTIVRRTRFLVPRPPPDWSRREPSDSPARSARERAGRRSRRRTQDARGPPASPSTFR